MKPNQRGGSLAGVTNLALMAPVRQGHLAPGFEPISYLERLRRLLDAMHASRRNARESELLRSVFPDSIGRFGIISGFRYALVPPTELGVQRWHLSLNVTFDGGWEPYMRVIYRDIGPLLDALLCHCEGYPGSRTSDFDTYCRWVRSAEFANGIFYTDPSGATLADQNYLASVERIQRDTSDPAAAERQIAAHAEPDDATAAAKGLQQALGAATVHLPLHLRALKGLYRLTGLWADSDGDILLRFAQGVLEGLRKVMADPTFAANTQGQLVRQLFADELAWLARPLPGPQERHRPWTPDLLQAALRDDAGPRATHGALVLLRVTDPIDAARHLASLAPRCALPMGEDSAVRVHVAFTMAGLRALQVHSERLGRLPPEFQEGMEARAGLLGDLRSNHPDHWHRPLRHGVDPTREDRIDLGAAHVVLVLRVLDRGDPDHALHAALAAEVAQLGQPGTGLMVLAVEPTRSRTGEADMRDHFGFRDGISQPVVAAERVPDPRKHEVRPGELVLGFANDRGDRPDPQPSDVLLDMASFLVVRKLRQRLDHLQEALAAAAATEAERTELLERMMGRRKNGEPLVAAGPDGINDFDFRGADGAQCPFASHVRRTNPRDGRPAMPRILRRGMGYGPAKEGAPDADRGTMFMAYCASISEQFETVQRWVAGGNSSGVGSVQSDPLMGVPRAGESRVFRWVDASGAAKRAELGAKAFVELQWGIYLFVPALPALRQLADLRNPPAAAPAPPAPSVQPEVAALNLWRERLEDRDNGRATWRNIREQWGGELDVPAYGQLVGNATGVFNALADDTCQRVSVRGFGERMDRTGLGVNHLGMDPSDGHTAVGKVVNSVVGAVDEFKAFAAASAVAEAVLAKILQLSSGPFALRHPDGRLRVPIDLMNFSEQVVGALGKLWFGLPDGTHMVAGGRVPTPNATGAPPRCPGHIIGPSRAIFGAHPHERVNAEGDLNGPQVRLAVKQALAAAPGQGALTDALRQGLAPLGSAHGPDLLERELVGLLLGFAPTVHGNFLTVMKNWIESERLWALQQALAEQRQAGAAWPDAAMAALKRPMLDTMQGEPVPPMVWRCPVVKGTPDTKQPPVVLGLASAIEDLDAQTRQAQRDALLFGGDYSADKASGRWGLHACPGSKMGVGVMLAMAAKLLDAGTLRPTGSPVLLMLTPKTPAP